MSLSHKISQKIGQTSESVDPLTPLTLIYDSVTLPKGRRSHLKRGAEKNGAHYGWVPQKILYFTFFQVTQNRVSVFIETLFSCNNKDKICFITSYPYILRMTNRDTKLIDII